jgi:two-component sensor histidine kinase
MSQDQSPTASTTPLEDQLRASLREKEELLREIHHRVKNNFQVILSLLNLQGAAVHDPATLEMLQETQNRVRSMALIHERLHRSSTLVDVDFDEYTRSMTSQLIRSYAKGGIAVSLEVDRIVLNMNSAIPLGLLLNELTSNAIKHGFPNGRTGTVNIALVRLPKNMISLTVADDGVGLPDSINWRSASTMGMTLIVGLAHQLDGSVEVDTTHGTKFTVTFPGT